MQSIEDFFKTLFDTTGFMPRWMCGKWTEMHGWLYIVSNLAIWAAYFTIPFLIFFFIRRKKDLPFLNIFTWFILFIIGCGITHFTDAIMFWFPVYRLNALFLFITAIISWVTVYVLIKNIPKALELKTPAQLKKIIEEQTLQLTKANAALQESEHQFKALVNNNPDIIARFNKHLQYEFINESMQTLTSTSLDFYLGKTPYEVLPTHPHTHQFTESIKKVFSTATSLQYEIQIATEKQGIAFFAVQMIPLINQSTNEVESVLTITKNISESKNNEIKLIQTIEELNQLTKRLELKRKRLQDFSYMVSHNLRSPIANLHALSALYKKEKNDEVKTFVMQKIFDVQAQLSTTVQELTQVVNITTNTDIERTNLIFEDMLLHLIESLYAQITDSKAKITYNFTSCPQVQYPKVYLESIMLNLLTNALKYASPNRIPEIYFETNISETGLITLVCTDNGQGIDMIKHGNKLFSLHKTFHNHPDARGVGLFITRNQIESLGGSIHAISEVDKGTTFIIHFNETMV